MSKKIEKEKTKKTIFPHTTFNVEIKILCYVGTPGGITHSSLWFLETQS